MGPAAAARAGEADCVPAGPELSPRPCRGPLLSVAGSEVGAFGESSLRLRGALTSTLIIILHP